VLAAATEKKSGAQHNHKMKTLLVHGLIGAVLGEFPLTAAASVFPET
jgi:hypothetical protein